jgi:CheY-like chemotaxis protein
MGIFSTIGIARGVLKLAASLMGLFSRRRPKISELEGFIPRDRLKREGRILFVDDERPDIVEDLEKQGFNVRYMEDIRQEDLHNLESNKYDVLILDYFNVGNDLGDRHGLGILAFVKRVNPRIHVLAYTSKLLGTDDANFFRNSDGVLKKDLGIADTMEQVEDALSEALSVRKAWQSLLHNFGVTPNSEEDHELQVAAVKAQNNPKRRSELMDKLASKKNIDAAKDALDLLDRVIKLVSGKE